MGEGGSIDSSQKRDIIVVGTSAGGVETLTDLCSRLPASLAAATFIVLHTSPNAPGLLPAILNRSSALTALFPVSGQRFEYGKIYIAPPNRHLIIRGRHVFLYYGPKENLLRPAADTLFRSAAENFGQRVIGVVLSGTRNDGALGLELIHKRGGITIVQDPEEALFSGMPISAIKSLDVDYILPIDQIAQTLIKLCGKVGHHVQTQHAVNSQEAKSSMTSDPDPDELLEPFHDRGEAEDLIRKGTQEFEHDKPPDGFTPLTCPECGGVVWEVKEGNLTHYVCHVGHKFSEGSFFHGVTSKVEEALWKAVRTLEERAFLSRKLAVRAEESSRSLAAKQFYEAAEEALRSANIIRQIAVSGRVTGLDETDAGNENG